jgi:hypothetical protein
MSLEDMYRRGKRQIKKRDAELAKQGTTAGQEAAKRLSSLSKAQLSSSARWALENPDNARYDNDGNPKKISDWF